MWVKLGVEVWMRVEVALNRERIACRLQSTAFILADTLSKAIEAETQGCVLVINQPVADLSINIDFYGQFCLILFVHTLQGSAAIDRQKAPTLHIKVG